MRVHFTAIGGAVMHSLAIALHRQGYIITGSDDKIADPARANLALEGLLPPSEGFYTEKITADLDAIILGMHARIDNPELLRAQELGIAVYSFPQYIYQVAKDKKRIVIAGSHGKTTITSMVMHVLHTCGLEIDYLVGARVRGFDTGVRLSTTAPIIVLEGDEYLASPTDRESKFLFYHPHIALVSGIAWDHINVFPVYEDYVKQFARFADTVEAGGFITYYEGDAELQKIFKHYRNDVTIRHYGSRSYRVENGKTIVQTEAGEVELLIFGEHNMQNLEGAFQVCAWAGIEEKDFFDAMRTFEGAANRLEKLGEKSGTVIYKDFAHSPSKLRATVAAMKAQYPTRRLVAVMELHTFSSLNKDFLGEYSQSMAAADTAIVYLDQEAMNLKKMPPLEQSLIRESFDREDLQLFTRVEELSQYLQSINYDDTNLLLMTSGQFGGMDVKRLLKNVLG